MTSTTTHETQYATSADGTEIAYEVRGSGPAVVLVDGALCQRAMGPSRGLARELAASFSVYAYDRRGRGDSGPGASPYAIEREVEDLLTVIHATGGAAHLLGVSSGALLALWRQLARVLRSKGWPFMRRAESVGTRGRQFPARVGVDTAGRQRIEPLTPPEILCVA